VVDDEPGLAPPPEQAANATDADNTTSPSLVLSMATSSQT
jgi:hypothetical protein